MRNDKDRGRGIAPAGDNMAAVQEIRQQIKAIKEAISIIEFKLSQLETVLRAQPSEESQQQIELPISARSAIARLKETPPPSPTTKLKVRRSNR